MGPAAVELLTAGIDGHTNQTNQVEELFGKLATPNVWTFAALAHK